MFQRHIVIFNAVCSCVWLLYFQRVCNSQKTPVCTSEKITSNNLKMSRLPQLGNEYYKKLVDKM